MVRCKSLFSAFAVKFSPFKDGRLAVATGQNFGVVGNGRLHVFEVGYISRRDQVDMGSTTPYLIAPE